MVRLTTDQVLNCQKKLEKIMGDYAHLMSREEIQEVIKNEQEDPFAMKPIKVPVVVSNKHTPQRYNGPRSRGSNVWAAKDAVIINDLIR